MGTDFSIRLYKKHSDNTDCASSYDELPNRYESLDEYYVDGRFAASLGTIFKKLFDKKNLNNKFVFKYVRATLDDFQFLFEELSRIQESEFNEPYAYSRKDIAKLLENWKVLLSNNDVDLYFFWT